MDRCVRVSADLGQQCAWLEEDVAQGFTEVSLHHLGPKRMQCIEAVGSTLLPTVAQGAPQER